MVTSLLQIAKQNKIPVEEPVELYDHVPWRFKEQEALAFLEKHLFRYGAGAYEKEQEQVKLHLAKNPREEAYAVAEQVRRMMREDRYRLRDIGVIVSDMDVYADHLKQAFIKYDIPFFMDHKRSILLNSFVEYIRSVLHMAEQSFSYESVFRFLRTNLAGFTYEEIDELENYVIGLGIKGYKHWQEKWTRKLRGMAQEDLDKMNHYRRQLVEKVDGLIYVLRQRRKTVADITRAIYEFMVQENLQVRLAEQEELFKAKGELALAREYAQIYRIVIELFDKFVELLGDEQVSLSEYCKLLDAGLEEARVGVIPPEVDQVVIGDMQRTRLKDIKALLFAGANDVYLPGALLRTGLLSELDREKFAREKLTLSAGGKEKAYVQKFYLYLNLTKPSEKLDIYYSKVSADGKSVRPSYLIQELQKLFPKLKVRDEERYLKEQELTENIGFDRMIREFVQKRHETDGAWCELYNWYKKNPKWQEKVERFLEAGYYRKPLDALTEEAAKRLYGEEFETSITRMERFAVCAFSHFLTYGLGLREREEYDFQAADLGNVCHRALERFSYKVEREAGDWLKLTEEKRKQYVEESVEEAIADYGNSILYSSSRNAYLIVRMKRMLEKTVWALTKQLAAGDFKPAAYELRFANGKIDRVDTCEDGDCVYVKVIDYKTGSKSFDVTALYHGFQLQLMVYMDAALQMEQKKHPEKEILPAGVFYYRIQDPLIDRPKEGEEQESILKELKPDGMISLEKEVLGHLDHCMVGESSVIPVKYNKNGSLSKSSKAASAQDFYLMMKYAVNKVEEIRQKILSGDVKVNPYRRGTETSCDYCSYRQICGFDTKMEGYRYREIEAMSVDKVIQAMKGEGQS